MSGADAVAARNPSADETALFRAMMHDVKPLRRQRRARPAEEPKSPSRIEAKVTVGARVALPAKPKATPNPGLDRRTAERLRKGEIAIERRIDLHGMTQDDAHAALDRFVRQAWKNGQRMLLVITGKGSGGEGVLRRGVPRWLAAGEHAAHVLRIETAQARHGGGGAFYVLLRRQRDRP
jgi:DNA-nicking Smr family endonuclease